MQTQLIILAGLATILVWAFSRTPRETKPAWARHLKGWQMLFGLVAFVLTILIMMNPEFLALGLLGDAAFFDMLVLALTLQMHMTVVRTFRWCVTFLARGVRWMGIPSPGLRYLLAISAAYIGGMVSHVQKIVHRIIS